MKNTIVRAGMLMVAIFGIALRAGIPAVSAPDQQGLEISGAAGASVKTNTMEDALVRQVAALLEAVNAMDDQGKPMVESGSRQNLTRLLTQLQRNVESKNYRSALQTCDGIASTPSSPSFQKMAEECCTAISLRNKAEQAALANELRGLLTSIPAACAAATNQSALQSLQSLSEKIQAAQNSLSRIPESENFELLFLRNNLQNAREMIKMWGECLAAESAGDSSKALELLNQMLSRSSLSAFTSGPEIKKRLEHLQAAVADDASKAIRTAREGMLKAATSRDAQALSLEFNRHYSRLQQNSNKDPILQQDLESTRNALSAWVRVLSAEERGDTQSALQSLQNMESDYYGRMDTRLQSLVAPKRSALLLKLLDQPPPADDSLVKVISDRLAAADSLDKLIELRRPLIQIASHISSPRLGGNAFQTEIQALMADLQTLENWRGALQSRQYGQILQLSSSPYSPAAYASYYGAFSHRWKILINRHMNQLRAQALAALFDLKDFEAPEGRTPDEALLQAADKAAADKQWGALAVYLDAYRVAVFGSQTPPASLTDRINACRSLIAAMNYEKAGDIPRAAAAYLAALNAPNGYAPVEEAFKNLERLRKNHPDIFEKAGNVSATTAPATMSVP